MTDILKITVTQRGIRTKEIVRESITAVATMKHLQGRRNQRE